MREKISEEAAREKMIRAKIPGERTGIEVRRTLCSICNPHSHCGIDAYVKDGAIIKVEGTRENPNSMGTLCSKGAASRQYIYNKDRIRTPLRRRGAKGSDDFEPVSWDEALDEVAERLLGVKREYGPESTVFFVGYPKWMRPFAKRLAHNYGSPNFCTESSTCFKAMYMAHVLNSGSFAPPDVRQAKCLLVWSSNPFYSNTPAAGKLLAAREAGLKIIEAGPLVTPLTSHADIHLRFRPGTTGALALALANQIIEEDLYDRAFVSKWTYGFEEFRAYARGFTPKKAEEITGVPADLIVKAARLYATTKPAAVLCSASPTVQHTNGVQNTRAIFSLIGLTGNFDVPGGNAVVPGSFLEVNGAIPTREEEFYQPRAFADMPPRVGEDKYPVWARLSPQGQAMHIPFQIESGAPYPIKAMVGFGFNYRMWPGSDHMKAAVEKLDFLAVADLFMTDSARLADIVLPVCSSFERSELKVYPGNYIFMTKPVIEPLYESRSDVDVICDLARRITPDDPLLTAGHEACLDWMLEPSGLTVEAIAAHEAGFTPPGLGPPKFRKYENSGFKTPTGKYEFSSTVLAEHGFDPLPVFKEPKLSREARPDLAEEYPLILTTGARLPMYIHSRTFRLGWNKRLRPHPMVDMNPLDAAERGLSAGDNVVLSTPRGSIRVKANLTEVVPAGVVSMYHAYPEADVNLLIDPDYLDPISAFPGFKSMLAQVGKA